MTEQTAPQAMEPIKAHRSLWTDVWRQFLSHKGAVAGMVILAVIFAFVILGPIFYWNNAQFVPTGRDFLKLRDMRPVYVLFWDETAKVNWDYPLGTDNLGRDILARLIQGGQISLAVGVTAMALSIVIGTLIGVLAGFFRRIDGALMRLTDLFLALPILPLLLVMIMLFRDTLRALIGPETGIFILVVGAVGITSWMQTARIVRGDVLSLKEREFVLAARAIGTRPGRTITRHIMPNVLSPIMVSATLGLASAIITESALSFLGLGFPSDFPTWGRLLYEAKDYLRLYPERVIWPGLAISLTVLSVNYMGDGLRDALDPRRRV